MRQDHQCAHPRPVAELRAGPDVHALRDLPKLPRARPGGTGQRGRHRDRRGQPRRRRRRPRPAGARVLQPRRVPLQGVRRRRGAHGQLCWLQRAAQGRRGAAGAPEVRLRDHRAGEGDRHHPVADPPLPVPVDPAPDDGRAPGLDRGAGGHPDRAGRAPPRRARGGWICARRAVGAGPADRRGRRGRRDLRRRDRAARLHLRCVAGPGRRCAGRLRRTRGVRGCRAGDRGRTGPAPVRGGPAAADARPRRPRCRAGRRACGAAGRAAGDGGRPRPAVGGDGAGRRAAGRRTARRRGHRDPRGDRAAPAPGAVAGPPAAARGLVR